MTTFLTLANLSQVFIAIFGVSAVACSQSTNKEAQRWASVLGLVGQPFWFYSAVETQQWGIFALCILYSISWGRGLWVNWIAPAIPVEFPVKPTDRECIENALWIIREDGKWMGHNTVAAELTKRYEARLAPGWNQARLEHVSELRARLGIVAPTESPRVAVKTRRKAKE